MAAMKELHLTKEQFDRLTEEFIDTFFTEERVIGWLRQGLKEALEVERTEVVAWLVTHFWEASQDCASRFVLTYNGYNGEEVVYGGDATIDDVDHREVTLYRAGEFLYRPREGAEYLDDVDDDTASRHYVHVQIQGNGVNRSYGLSAEIRLDEDKKQYVEAVYNLKRLSGQTEHSLAGTEREYARGDVWASSDGGEVYLEIAGIFFHVDECLAKKILKALAPAWVVE